MDAKKTKEIGRLENAKDEKQEYGDDGQAAHFSFKFNLKLILIFVQYAVKINKFQGRGV